MDTVKYALHLHNFNSHHDRSLKHAHNSRTQVATQLCCCWKSDNTFSSTPYHPGSKGIAGHYHERIPLDDKKKVGESKNRNSLFGARITKYIILGKCKYRIIS